MGKSLVVVGDSPERNVERTVRIIAGNIEKVRTAFDVLESNKMRVAERVFFNFQSPETADHSSDRKCFPHDRPPYFAIISNCKLSSADS